MSFTRSHRLAVSAVALLAVTGCTFTPDAKPNAGALPTDWTAAVAKPEAPSLSAWWEDFADPTLAQLTAEGLVENIDLRQAVLRITEARANNRRTIAAFLPQLSATAQAQYTNVLQGPPLTGNIQSLSQGQLVFEDVQAFGNFGPQISWEIPLWGRIPLSAAGARLNRQIAQEDARAALVTFVGDMANAYIDLRSAQNRREVLLANLDLADRLAKSLEDSVPSGFTAPADAADARRQAESIRARLPDVEVEAYVARNNIALLRGRAPGTEPDDIDAALETIAPIPNRPLDGAPAAPADLLRLRPDVARAERQALLEAVQVGNARQELLPQLTFTGNVGFADNLIGFPLPERIGQLQLTPLLTVPLFDWGQRLAVAKAERTQFESALLEYKDTVNRAVAEADQALVELARAEERLRAAQAAERAAEASAEGAAAAFEVGLRSLRDRLQVEQLLIDARLTRVQAESQKARASVAVYRAFAGALAEPTLAAAPTVAAQAQPVSAN